MKTQSVWLMTGLGMLMAGVALAETPGTITGDRVNLRARPELTAEVIGQLSYDDVVTVRRIDEEWVEILPPDAVEFWIHRDFLDGDRVTTRRLNVRAGAGINYSIVGALERNDVVERRGSFGEWVKISPPASSSVFVSRSFVEVKSLVVASLPAPPRLEPVVPALPAYQPLAPFQPASSPHVVSPTLVGQASRAASDLNLVPLPGQGALVQKEGTLARTPLLLRSGTSPFRLIQRDGKLITTLCFVRGNTSQLEGLLDQTLIVHGREYWVEGARQPVVLVEKIERRANR